MKEGKGNLREAYPVWKLLEEHYEKIKKVHLRQLFEDDPQRGEKMVVKDEGIYFDYSKHRITSETINLLLQLAEQSALQSHIEAMFSGEKINISEDRAVLHIALRSPRGDSIIVDGEDVVVRVHEVLDQMANFASQIRSGQWKGFTGKSIRNVISIGIGGSNLGPEMAYQALRYYSIPDIKFSFLSNIDGTDFYQTVSGLNPEETLFIISSKSFTTPETMVNTHTARTWLLNHLKDDKAISKHFVAISTNRTMVQEFGIAPENMFVFWDWVGGRYSLCSAIGLSVMIAIGPENFYSLLRGAHRIDQHFRHTPLVRNIPVLMALLSIWYNNFFGAETSAILPYEQYLKLFPVYLQQVTMESNGKCVDIDGKKVSYQTGQIYWGEVGTNGQHSFYQLMHQGTKLIPCDFIAFLEPLHKIGKHHELLISNVFAQAEALAFGKTEEVLRKEGVGEKLIPYRVFEGNRPSSMIILDRLTPENLGKLIALYEHTVFTQGIIWKINSFDQWGVELGKVLATRIAEELKNPAISRLTHDSSTNRLIKKYWERNRG